MVKMVRSKDICFWCEGRFLEVDLIIFVFVYLSVRLIFSKTTIENRDKFEKIYSRKLRKWQVQNFLTVFKIVSDESRTCNCMSKMVQEGYMDNYGVCCTKVSTAQLSNFSDKIN